MIPKKIHFAGRNYKVIEMDKLDGEESWGRTMMGSAEIFLEKGLSEDKKTETLIHELIHIAYRHTSKSLSDEQEENIVRPWSMNIFGILKDNGFLKAEKSK